MSIRYALFENRLTSGVDDYTARVQEAGLANLDAVFKRVVEQGERLNETDARSVMYKVMQACERDYHLVPQLHLGTRGGGPKDRFDASRQRVDVAASQGLSLAMTAPLSFEGLVEGVIGGFGVAFGVEE